MTYDKNMYYLSFKSRDRLISIMDHLKDQGYPTDNRVMIMVLDAMRDKGLLPQVDNKGMLDLIKKIVPPGGKILHIKEGNDERK